MQTRHKLPKTVHNKVVDLKPFDFRTAWISDVHLGFKGCKAELLLDFLKAIKVEQLYLVGDIVDLWSMTKVVHWPQSHNNVVRKLLSMAKKGTRIIYIPGNHDDPLRDYDGMCFGNVVIRTCDTHVMADGRQFLVMHGDEFDSAVKCNRLLSFLGFHFYDFILELNRSYNYLRRKLGLPYWSLSNYIKHRVDNAVKYITRFEEAVAHEANKHGVDGLICGHIHRANMRNVNGVEYCNTGDWVESCTALVEHRDGRLELINWAEHVRLATGSRLPAVECAA